MVVTYMENILLLCGKNNILFDFNKTNKNVIMDDLYIKNKLFKFGIHIPIISRFFLGKWKNNLKGFDTIIFFDSILTKETLNEIIKLKFNGRKILFFRNQVLKRNIKWNFKKISKKGIEIWSYNIDDCQKYGFKYNNETLSYEMITSLNEESDIKHDLVFIGENKGREDLLIKVENYCIQHNIDYYFYVLYSSKLKKNMCIDNKYMRYSDYVKLISNSKAILDIVEKLLKIEF